MGKTWGKPGWNLDEAHMKLVDFSHVLISFERDMLVLGGFGGRFLDAKGLLPWSY